MLFKKINNIVEDDKNKVSNNQSKIMKVENSEKKKFLKYISKNKLKYNMNKQTFWFEYGGHLIAKYSIKSQNEIDNNNTTTGKNENNVNKWKLINKYMETFPMHFIVLYIDETYGYFLIGGTDGENTFQ